MSDKIFKMEPIADTGPWGKLNTAVVAFDPQGYGHIIAVCGTEIQQETEALGFDRVEVLGEYPANDPDNGIWIWEGKFSYSVDHDGDSDYTTSGTWRQPTPLELADIADGNYEARKLKETE